MSDDFNVLKLQERGGDQAIKMARRIMAAKTDPHTENTREECLASDLLAAHDFPVLLGFLDHFRLLIQPSCDCPVPSRWGRYTS